MALVLGEKSGKPKEFDYDHFLMKMENKFRTYVKPFDSLKQGSVTNQYQC